MQGGNNKPQNGNERGFFSNLIPGYSSSAHYPGYPPHGYPQPAPSYHPGAYPNPYPPAPQSGYPSPGTYPGHGSTGNMAPLLAGGALAAVAAYGAHKLSHGHHHHGHHHHGHHNQHHHPGFGMHHGHGHHHHHHSMFHH